MEKENHYRIRPLRMVNYLLVLVLDIFLYSVLQSYFLWVTAMILIILPLLSVVGLVYLGKNLSPKLGIGQMRLVKGEEVLLELYWQNPIWYMALHSQIQVTVSNTFLEHTSEFTAVMPVSLRGTSSLRMPVQVVELGRFWVQGDTLLLQDIMGLVICRKKIDLSGEMYVLPDGKMTQEMDLTGWEGKAAETEESRSKGSDFAEVSDIREYIPGDRIRDIHWKLSAKQETLMVKERVAVAGSEMVMLLSLTADPIQAQSILETAYYLGKSFIRQRLPVCFLCWNQAAFSFGEYRCGTEEEMKDVFCEIYQAPLTERVSGGLGTYMRNCYPFLKSYLLIGGQDGTLKVEMCEND
ncbi:MAG: DUF58 domain-containing protein [Lachnospiraceae bacterium]|nr:DUF58 domain-containing protein [Lachnospiraceae bacterium]